MKKIIGTSVPMSALWNNKVGSKQGNLDTALLFLDWLHKTGQSAWQLLPIHETQLVSGRKDKHVPSPYKGYGIGLDSKYLSANMGKKIPSKAELSSFIKTQKEWLGNYTLFCALRDYFGTDDWTKWEPSIRKYNKKTLKKWNDKLEKEIQQYVLQQWQLDYGFRELRKKAGKYNIQLIGDLSFYIPLQSPLVWQFQKIFQIDKDYKMKSVSGLPNGPRAHFGRQVWGHPLYKWKAKGVFDLWKLRLNYTSQLFDIVRLDHAKGFFSYGSMSIKDPKKDRIKKGPGKSMLKKIIIYSNKIGLKLFAEDSGDRLKELRDILKSFRIPGIRILRFAYNEKREKLTKRYADVNNYPVNTFAQTTTHDTSTLLGYLNILSTKEKKILSKNCNVKFSNNNKILTKRLRTAVINSPARTVIIPIQDWLLDTKRINIPGTEKSVGDKNWQYHIPIPIEELPAYK